MICDVPDTKEHLRGPSWQLLSWGERLLETWQVRNYRYFSRMPEFSRRAGAAGKNKKKKKGKAGK